MPQRQAHWATDSFAVRNPAGTSVSPPAIRGAPLTTRSWTVQRWRMTDGLPANHVRTLRQTSDGYLWIGTSAGLARFDGRRFTRFNTGNISALTATGQDVRSLVEDASGSLWILTRTGIARVEQNRWTIALAANATAPHRLRDLAVGRAGEVWVASDLGLRRLVDGALTTGQIPPGLEQTYSLSVRIDATDQVWVANAGGVYSWSPREERLAVHYVSPPESGLVSALALGPDRVTVRGGSHLALRTWSTNEMTTLRLPEPETASAGLCVDQIACGPGGDAWVSLGDRSQVYHATDGRLEPILAQDGLPVEGAVCLEFDAEGDLWVGTRTEGLLRLRPTRFRTLAMPEPMPGRLPRCVAESPDGSVWCGTAGGVVQWAANGIRLFEYEFGIYRKGLTTSVLSLITEPATVWAGFHSAGLVQLDPAAGESRPETARFGARLGDGVGQVRALIRRRSGELLLGTYQGVYVVEPGRDPTPLAAVGLPADLDVRCLLEDHTGAIWIGTRQHGLWRYSPAGSATAAPLLQHFTTDNGLVDDTVWALYEDAANTLWVGTQHGLSRRRHDRWTRLNAAQGLPGDAVYCLVEDHAGRFWMNCGAGVFRVDRDALGAVADGLHPRVEGVLFTELDGLPSDALHGENQPCGCRASDGRIYFPTSAGLAVVDPTESEPASQPPRSFIEQIQAGDLVVYGDDCPYSAAPTAPPNAEPVIRVAPGRARALRIRYTATSLRFPERVQLQHRLDGLDREWQDGTPERLTYYANLKPGAYRFRIRAAMPPGTWTESSAGIALVLEPHVWQTPWFYGASAVAVGAVGFGLLRWRLGWQRRMLRLEQRAVLDRERSRITRDMHDELGARLSEVLLVIGGTPAEPPPDAGSLRKQVGDILRQLNEIIWAVNPENDSLGGLTDFLASYGPAYLGRAGLRVELDLPATTLDATPLPPGLRRHFAAAFKELLRNIAQHARARRVRVSLRIQARRIELEIADDGCGFQPPSVPPASGGLAHLDQRLTEIQGEMRLESRPGEGTRAVLSAPLASCP